MENNQPDKDDILAYIVKMHERGDRYADILRYLQRKNVDADTRRDLLEKLDVLTKPFKDTGKRKEPKYYPVSYARIIVGTLFFAFTLWLLHVGVLPLLPALVGILFVPVIVAEIIKIFLNLFK